MSVLYPSVSIVNQVVLITGGSCHATTHCTCGVQHMLGEASRSHRLLERQILERRVVLMAIVHACISVDATYT